MRQRIVCLTLWVLLLCSGCGVASPAPTAPASVPATTVPETTAAATTVPVESTAAFVWDSNIHSGITEDGSFDEGTLFIGDSLTTGLVCQYLMPEGRIGNAHYLAKVGAPLRAFLNRGFLLKKEDSICSLGWRDLSFTEGVCLAGGQIRAVYFMMGTNFDNDNCAESYIQAVDFLLETCPDATIYLQTIPQSTSDQVHWEQVNASIREAQQHFAEQGIQRVMVIDTCAAIGDSTGDDKVHLNPDGYRLWYEAIAAFMADNQIPQ